MSQVEVGRVIKPHGIRGEVGVLLHQADSDLLERINAVTLQTAQGESVAAELERIARMGRGYRVKFSGFNDRTAAERLRGATLSVPRDVLPALPGDECYLVDLVGAKVMGPDGQDFGVVIDVQSYPSVDSAIIEMLDGTQVEQPLVDEWVNINDAPRRLALKSLEGLL